MLSRSPTKLRHVYLRYWLPKARALHLRDVASIVLLLAAVYLGSGALLIHAKAVLAPVLIKRAWAEMLIQPDEVTRPWPWADTWPVARMQVPAHGIDLPVLAGDSGNALAFAPGHANASAVLGSRGLAVIGGHRDTHFAFLRHVQTGDVLRLQLRDGRWREYRVVSFSVADARTDALAGDTENEALLLVTCYPFDALTVNGPMRYVIRLEPTQKRAAVLL